jgi:Ni/Co efflux regulator RcnB
MPATHHARSESIAEGCTMKKSLLAAATALMLLGAAGTASADSHRGHEGHHDKGHSDERSRHDRDCDGIPNGRDHHDQRNAKDKDCDGIANRFDHHDGRGHDARRSFAAPRYIGPRDYRYARYDYGTRLPTGYWGRDYYVDYQPYGLAPPQEGYRWNRVGNDVYLVSLRDGLIAEAVYSVFR